MRGRGGAPCGLPRGPASELSWGDAESTVALDGPSPPPPASQMAEPRPRLLTFPLGGNPQADLRCDCLTHSGQQQGWLRVKNAG